MKSGILIQVTGLLAAAVAALSTPATHAGVRPYGADANTLHLWHLDQADPGPAAPDVCLPDSFELTPGGGAVLGAASFPGFGTAGDTTAGIAAGFQGPSITPDALTGADGAFTFEAIIRPANITDIQQIIGMDNSDANANRPFQFRIDGGQLRFINIGGSSVEQILTLIPTTGPDAFVADEWFHVAVSYNGNENTADNIKLYWTRVDAATTSANEILSTTMLEDLTGTGTVFGVANEYRGTADNNLKGLIDEVRISDVARGPDQFIFYDPAEAVPPTLSCMSPADDDPSAVPAGIILVAYFSEPIAAGTGNITIRNLTDMSDTIIAATDATQVTIDGTSLTINPAADLLAPKDYAVRIDATAIEDLAGNSFAGILDDTSWNFSTDGTPPSIVSRFPADGSIEVLTGATLQVGFDEPILVGSGSITIRQSSDDMVVEAFDVTSSSQLTFGTSSITINPAGDLPAGIGLYVQIDPGAIEDAAGNGFPGITDTSSWSFVTAASQSTVVLFRDDFSDGSPGVPVDPNDPGASISGTLAGSFIGDPYIYENVAGGSLGGEAGGSASWSNANAPNIGSGTLTLNCDFASNASLRNARQFSVHLLGLNPVDDPDDGTSANWAAVNLFQGAFPSNGATDDIVRPNTGFGILFRDNGSAQLWSAGTSIGPVTFDAAPVGGSYDVTIRITNISGFGPGNSFDYEILVDGSPVSGASGTLSGIDTSRNLISLETRSFSSTVAEFRVETTASDVDILDPLLMAVSPPDDSLTVVPAHLVAAFDEPVAAGTGTIAIRRTSDDSLVESFVMGSSPRLTISGGTLTIDPTSDLPDGGLYVLIDAGAITDGAGNGFAGILDTTGWSFTVDAFPPASSGMVPMTAATGVAPYADLTLSFGEDVRAGTGNITIHLAGDDSVVQTIDVTSGAVTITGGQVTINPPGDLEYGTAYYVQVDAGAFTDLAGNPFAGISDTTTWAFTTGPIPSGLIFSEDFSGDTGDLNGTAPDERPFLETWVAAPIFNQDGSIDQGPGSATLAFTPFDGLVYQLEASIRGISGDGDWFALGFANGQSAASNTNTRFITGTVVGTAWMLIKGDASAASNNAFLGTGQLGAGNNGLTSSVPWAALTTENPGGDIDLRIVLDTTAGPGAWTATWYAKRPADAGYTEMRPTAPMLSESFNAVGLAVSNPGVFGTITSFSLSTVSPLDPFLQIAPLGGSLWELTLEAEPDTAYEFRSSPTLDFNPGTLVEDLVQGNPGTDPGTIGGTNDSLVTTDGNGDATVIAELTGPRNFVRASLPPPLFAEDFDTTTAPALPTDWTTGFEASDLLMNTTWELGDPAGGPPSGPAAAFNGTNCVGTNLLATYGTVSDTWLRTPPIDLTAVSGAALSFHQWLDIDPYLNADRGTVRVLAAGTLTELAVLETNLNGLNPTNWASFSANLPTAALGQPVVFEFGFVSDNDTTLDQSGWYIDDVKVTRTAP